MSRYFGVAGVGGLKQRLERGVLIVLVTHELEPFVSMASAAVGMLHGKAQVYSTLPENSDQKAELLERLAQGRQGG